MTRNLRTWLCEPTSAARRPSPATSSAPCPICPTCGASIRHVVGAGQGGGFEWHSAGRAVPRGAAALELSKDGKITKFTVVWDGSLLDDTTITAAAAHALNR